MKYNSKSVYFVAPYQVEIRREPFAEPGKGQVIIQSLCSAISPGTEMLVYRGNFPANLAVDESISALQGDFRYPLRYGYAVVGKVVELGPGVDPNWLNRMIFSFQPHTSTFLASTRELLPLPAGIEPEDAVFLPNMETAVNFVMDGAPILGEQVIIFGQGIVGLLTTALLIKTPIEMLISLDCYPNRRQASLGLGVKASLDPEIEGITQSIERYFPSGADLVFEISGSPLGLQQAIQACGFGGRVIIGSWYGNKTVPLQLGDHFHRSRIRLISSQVTTIAPNLSARWDKERRFKLAWEMIRNIMPSQWITQRYPIEKADQAYELLEQHPEKAIQVIITY